SDSSAYAGGNGVTYSGFVSGEDQSVLGGTVAYGGTAQGAVNAGTYALTASGLTSGNYAISYNPGTLTVGQAALAVTAINASKTYDSAAYTSGNGVTFSGFVGAENQSVLGGAITYGGTAQGAVNAGTYSLIATGLTSGNYAISYNPGTLIIGQAALAVTVTNASKTYDSAAYAGGNGVTYNGFVGSENQSVLGGALSYGGTAQGAVNAGTYALTASGLTSGNYAISYNSGMLMIAQAALAVTATNASKTYDSAAYAGGNGVTYSGFVGSENSAVLGGAVAYGGAAQGAVNAGTYALTVSGLTSGNYAISYNPGTLTVGQAALAVTATNASKIYDSTAYAGGNGVTYSGFVGSENQSVLGGVLSYGGAAQGAVNAGAYVLTASGLTSGNYAISYNAGTLTVNQAALAVTALNAGKTYNGAAYTGGNGVTFSGFVGGENQSVLGGAVAYGGTAQGAVNAGIYGLTASGLTSGNYAISYNPGTLTVGQAALAVTANNASKTYDSFAYAGNNGVTYSGFVGSENQSVLGGTLAYGGAAQGAVNAGSYALTASGLTSGNYAISYNPGMLTVSQAALAVTVTNAGKTYDSTAYTGGNGVTYSGFVGGENPSVLGGAVAYGGAAQGAVNAGTYALTASGLASGNYVINYTPGMLTVGRAALTVKTSDATRTYNGLANSGGNGVTYSGLVGNETPSVLAGSLVYGGPSQGAVDAGSYALIAAGLTSSNYAITYLPGVLSVGQAALIITANNAAKTYDGKAFAGGAGASYSGMVNGESPSVLSGSLIYGGDAQGAVNEGIYALTVNGQSSNNYSITTQPGVLVLSKTMATPNVGNVTNWNQQTLTIDTSLSFEAANIASNDKKTISSKLSTICDSEENPNAAYTQIMRCGVVK
ncbi:MAG: beta strand repeat-containing protein, partial [Janthinobacterium lividum]